MVNTLIALLYTSSMGVSVFNFYYLYFRLVVVSVSPLDTCCVSLCVGLGLVAGWTVYEVPCLGTVCVFVCVSLSVIFLCTLTCCFSSSLIFKTLIVWS